MIKKYLLLLLLSFGSTHSFSQIYGVGNGDGYAVSCIIWDIPVLVPNTLLKFNAVCSGEKTTVRWSVPLGYGGDYFIVERSTDGIYFQPAASIKVKEGNSELQSYSWNDYTELSGTIYYRLKLTESSGISEYSYIVFVNCKKNDTVSVNLYPNPTTGILNIITNQQKTSLVIKNISGQAVLEYKTNSENTRIDLGHLPAGLYYIEVQTPHHVSYHKIIVSRK